MILRKFKTLFAFSSRLAFFSTTTNCCHVSRLSFTDSQQKETYERILRLLSYGEISVGAMDYRGAWVKYQEALQLSEDTFGGEEAETAVSLHKLGDLYQIEGKFSKSFDLYNRALNIVKKFEANHQNRNLIASLEKSIGLLFKHTENYPKALDYLMESARFWSELDEYDHALQSLMFLQEMVEKGMILEVNVISEIYDFCGDIYTRVGELKLAEENLSKALRLKLEGKLGNLGVTYALLGFLVLKKENNNLQKSLDYISKGINLCLKSKDKNQPILARSFATLGCINEVNKDYEKALENLTNSYNLFMEISGGQEDVKSVKVLTDMGNIYFYQDNCGKALECFEKSVKIVENTEINDPDFLSTLFNNLATLYIKLDRQNEASKYLSKAILLKEEMMIMLNYSDNQEDVLDLGHLYRKLGIIFANDLKFQEAKVCFEKSFEAYNRVLGEFDVESQTTSTLLTEVKNRIKDLQKIETI